MRWKTPQKQREKRELRIKEGEEKTKMREFDSPFSAGCERSFILCDRFACRNGRRRRAMRAKSSCFSFLSLNRMIDEVLRFHASELMEQLPLMRFFHFTHRIFVCAMLTCFLRHAYGDSS